MTMSMTLDISVLIGQGVIMNEEKLMEESAESRYEALIQVSQAISSYRDPKQLFAVLETELRRIVRFDWVLVELWDEQTRKWKLEAMRPPYDFPYLDVHPDPEEMIAWFVYQNQQPFVISSVEEESRFPKSLEFLRTLQFQSASFFPLTTSHRRLGVLSFASKEKDAYSEEEIRFLWMVAREIALSIDNALNFDANERARKDLLHEHQRLQLLLDLTNTIVSTLELREVLRTVCSNVRRVMDCVSVAIELFDPENNQVQVYTLDFPDSKGYLKEGFSVPIENTFSDRAFQTRKPVIVVGLDQAKMSPPLYQGMMIDNVKSVCFLPMINRNRKIGILLVGKSEEEPCNPSDLDFLMLVANQVGIAVENALAYQQIEILRDRLAQEKLYLEDEIRYERNFEEMIGESASLRKAIQQIETVAPTDSTVLILGETGTGKELVARAIHNRSRRKDRSFIKVNCAAIPTGLLESEFFGHEKGSFTGAISQRIGRLEMADQGTLFLDEIGDIPLELQSKLLRVLQEREFERLGSNKTKRVDVRLVTATNRNLQKMVSEHQFRSDLFYRLNVFPIRIPPLRERPEDIPLLVRFFTQKYARRMEKQIENIPTASMKKLIQWWWPGNIRELENFVERAVILTSGQVLNLPLSELDDFQPIGEESQRADKERDEIIRTLKDTNGRIGGPNGAAIRLGLKRTTLISRMKKWGINPKEL